MALAFHVASIPKNNDVLSVDQYERHDNHEDN